MRERVHVAEQRSQGRRVAAMHGEEHLPHRLFRLGEPIVDAELHPVEHDLAGQRVAVGVQPGRRIADELVAGRHAIAVQRLVLLDDADDRARQVVVTRLVQIGHLRRLTAGQRHVVRAAAARHAADDLRGDLRDESPGRDVVEKGERRGAVDQDVVHRVIDEIFADGVVNPRRGGHEHLGSHAVGGHHEDGLPVAVRDAHHAAEPADGAARQGRACRAHQLGDAALRLLGGVELHPHGAVAVGFGHSSPSKEKCTRSRNALTRPRTSGSVTRSSRWTPNASTASDPIADP